MKTNEQELRERVRKLEERVEKLHKIMTDLVAELDSYFNPGWGQK